VARKEKINIARSAAHSVPVPVPVPVPVRRSPEPSSISDSDSSVHNSCHRCHSTFTLDQLMFCSHIHPESGRKNKSCKKKYCARCLSKIAALTGRHWEWYPDSSSSSWQCPSCCNECPCSSCIDREQGAKVHLLERRISELEEQIRMMQKMHSMGLSMNQVIQPLRVYTSNPSMVSATPL
jgi:hypothetical protein